MQNPKKTGIIVAICLGLVALIAYIPLLLGLFVIGAEPEALPGACTSTIEEDKQGGSFSTPSKLGGTFSPAAEEKTDSSASTINVPAEYQEPIRKAAKTAGLPEAIIAAQVQRESNFDRHAGSPAGAKGPGQFTDATWAAYGNGGDVYDIEDSMDALGRYMKDLKGMVQKYAKNDANALVQLTLAAYNAGPGAVAKYSGLPPFAETQQYVKIITGASQAKFSQSCQQVDGAKAWDGDLGPGEWTNPLPGGQFTSGYGPRNVPGLPAWAQVHVGLDLATGSGYGPQGTVIAPTDLKITGLYEKDGCLLGTTTAEPHFRLAFCHMDDYKVSTGQEIKKGTVMGRESNHAGSVGTTVISHLHFEIHKPGADYTGNSFNPYDGSAIDPAPILKQKGAWS